MKWGVKKHVSQSCPPCRCVCQPCQFGRCGRLHFPGSAHPVSRAALSQGDRENQQENKWSELGRGTWFLFESFLHCNIFISLSFPPSPFLETFLWAKKVILWTRTKPKRISNLSKCLTMSSAGEVRRRSDGLELHGRLSGRLRGQGRAAASYGGGAGEGAHLAQGGHSRRHLRGRAPVPRWQTAAELRTSQVVMQDLLYFTILIWKIHFGKVLQKLMHLISLWSKGSRFSVARSVGHAA